MNDRDEFSGVFDDLTPLDFVRDSSARHVRLADTRPKLTAFVETSLDALRVGFYASDGMPNPVATLWTPSGRRLYSPDEDESLGQYINRLTREARLQGATAFFTGVMTEGGTYQGSMDDGATVDSPEALRHIAPKPCLYWYAEVLGEGVRHGIMTIVGNDTGEVFEGPAEHASPLYRQVLSGS